MYKKTISRVLIIAVLLSALSGLFILAEESPDYVSGVYTVALENADSVRINGKVINAVKNEGTVVIKVSGVDTEFCAVKLNGKLLGYLQNGYNNVFKFDESMIIEGENEVKVIPSKDNTVYEESILYGKHDLDDIVVESVMIIMNGKPRYIEYMKLYIPDPYIAFVYESLERYKSYQTIGDGWNSKTGKGGTTPDVPISIGYLFSTPIDYGFIKIDTTEFVDGVYDLDLLKEGKVIQRKSIGIDNTPPELLLSFKNGDTIANSGSIKFEASDRSPFTLTAYVNSKEVSGNVISLKSFEEGSHTLHIIATDSLGNRVEHIYSFNVKQTIPDYNLYYKKNGSAVLNISAEASATVYTADLIGRINMYINRLGSFNQTALRSSSEVLVSFGDKENYVTESVGNTLPYQSFIIDAAKNTGDAIISYTGETGNGEDILLKVWNYKTECWDTLARTSSGVSVSFYADTATYSKDGKIRVNAYPYVLSNGSDTLLWVSDTQYYSRYDDLNIRYTEIMNYAKNEYIARNIGYVVHTGDLIDQSQSGDAIAHKEYKIASDAQAILDNAFVPNGVVSGNHDIKHSSADYSYYAKYFGRDRYKNFEWFGGDFKNNTHHYDLITIGNYDFLFLYIGCYDEDSSETLAWANAVLQAFPERNVILCTHEYINSAGMYTGERAAVIWDSIVVPNENIKIILCGHNEGAANQLRRVNDSDRYVLEILANYQFAELGIEPSHIENNYTCDGEGFIRLMTFNEAGQVISTTYSPSADKYNYFPSYADTFVYDLDLIPSVRSIRTTAFSVGVNIREEGEFGKEEINLSGADSVFAVISEGSITHMTELLNLKDIRVPYTVFADTTHYKVDSERFEITGMRGVAASLRREESNKAPSDYIVKKGIDLMPSQSNKAYRTSGSTDYVTTYSEDGKYAIKFNKESGATWITTALNINKSIDSSEYNRLYFGVSADSNAKWNICLNLSNGTSLNFSQGLYEQFGYKDYFIPSDIQGTWQGYIPLDHYLSGEVTVSSIYYVAATSGSPVTFDYCFIGKGLGEEVLFVTDEETAYSVDAAKGSKVEGIPSPFKIGYTFEGWYTDIDGGEQVEFPYRVAQGGLTVYSRFTKKDTGGGNAAGITYFNNEVEVLPGTNYNEVIIIAIIIMTAFSGVAAGIISAFRRRKKRSVS